MIQTKCSQCSSEKLKLIKTGSCKSLICEDCYAYQRPSLTEEECSLFLKMKAETPDDAA